MPALLEALVDIDRMRRAKRREIYQKITDQCMARIMQYTSCQKYSCGFTVPVWMMGEPLYSWKSALKYVMRKLKSEGLRVQRLGGNRLFVTWDHVRRSKKKAEEQQHDSESEEDDDSSELPNLDFLSHAAQKIENRQSRGRTLRFKR